MNKKRPSRSERSTRALGCTQLERHVQTYRQDLLDRGNATSYVRRCEAAVMHLSMWMRQANRRLADVDEIRVFQRPAYGLRDEKYLRLKVLTCMLPAI